MVTEPLMRVDARAGGAGQSSRSSRELTMAVASTSRANSDYGRFIDDIHGMDLMPLWERVGGLRPGTNCVPKHWSYDEVRPQLLRAAGLVTKKEAERRVLCLENPSLRGTTFVTNS